jgi:hypothetical protein
VSITTAVPEGRPGSTASLAHAVDLRVTRYVELALATREPSTVSSASRKTALRPPLTTLAKQSTCSPSPHLTGARKLIFISTLAEVNGVLLWALAQATEVAPIAESASAARKPPWMMPTGFAKRSWAHIAQSVEDGSDLSRHTIPKLRSQAGGT